MRQIPQQRTEKQNEHDNNDIANGHANVSWSAAVSVSRGRAEHRTTGGRVERNQRLSGGRKKKNEENLTDDAELRGQRT
jgi:hypothetical protein